MSKYILFIALFFYSASWASVSKVEFQKAALHGNLEVIQEGLKEKGVEYVRLRDKQNNTPLHLACYALKGGEKAEIISLLIRHGAEINATNNFYTFPLHVAASSNNLAGAKLLLGQRGVLVNERSSANATPLLMAVGKRHIDMVKLLLSHPEIDPNQGTSDGVSPLHFAARLGYVEEAKLLLKDLRVNPNLKQKQGDFAGATPLHYAAMQAQVDMVSLLLKQKGLEVNEEVFQGIYEGFTPLHFAVMNPSTLQVFETLKLLIKGGANPNQKTKTGKLPSDLTSVRVILQFLEDPNPSYEIKKKQGIGS